MPVAVKPCMTERHFAHASRLTVPRFSDARPAILTRHESYIELEVCGVGAREIKEGEK